MASLQKFWNKCVTRDFPDPWAKRKLLRGLRQIIELPPENLQDVDALLRIIRGIGLRYDTRKLYGSERRYMNSTGNGLWQIPQQLAKTMVLLSNHRIESFLEIGTHTGYTFCVLCAYLHRLNPNLKALTVDPFDQFHYYSPARSLIPFEFKNWTSDDLKGRAFDCVLIDGDHNYDAVLKDFDNVGKYSQICMFHDVNDDLVGASNVPRFWKEMVTSEAFSETHEFLDCAPNRRIMGIGVGIRDRAQRREPAPLDRSSAQDELAPTVLG